jgi:hypothetical protein
LQGRYSAARRGGCSHEGTRKLHLNLQVGARAAQGRAGLLLLSELPACAGR